jgi:hypothetical protein
VGKRCFRVTHAGNGQLHVEFYRNKLMNLLAAQLGLRWCLGPVTRVQPVLVHDAGKRLAGLFLAVAGVATFGQLSWVLGTLVGALGFTLYARGRVGTLALELHYEGRQPHELNLGFAWPNRQAELQQCAETINAALASGTTEGE